MRNVWLTALLAQPPVILGRKLAPFSLSHSLILHAAGNPYWFGRECKPDDLIEAVLICSRTWEENQAWFANPEKRTAKKLAARMFFRREFHKAHDALAQYLNDACDVMAREVPDGDGAGKELLAPWQYRVACFLMKHGMTESQAWNCPINRARCYLDAVCEEKGWVTLCEEYKEDAYALVERANALMSEGKEDEANAIYMQVQGLFDRKNSATDALKKVLK